MLNLNVTNVTLGKASPAIKTLSLLADIICDKVNCLYTLDDLDLKSIKYFA